MQIKKNRPSAPFHLKKFEFQLFYNNNNNNNNNNNL